MRITYLEATGLKEDRHLIQDADGRTFSIASKHLGIGLNGGYTLIPTDGGSSEDEINVSVDDIVSKFSFI